MGKWILTNHPIKIVGGAPQRINIEIEILLAMTKKTNIGHLLPTVRAISFIFIGIFPHQGWSLDFEFLAFPEINISVEDYDKPRLDINPGIDFFASARYQDVSIIAEYFLNKNEAELERLLIGWDASDNIRLWLGRHHSQVGYWNTEFHHGAFLETSVTRPAITEFEDDGGILASHVTGFSGELSHSMGEALFRINGMLGLGPTYLSNQELAAFDILNPKPEDHSGSFSLKLSYYPKSYAANQVGLSVGGSFIPSIHQSFDKIEQLVVGSFANWHIADIRLISELNYVFNTVYRPNGSYRADILAGYLQAEYTIDQNWTVYGRVEGSTGSKRALSSIFPDFITDRQVAGFRFDLGNKYAFKLEIGRKRNFEGATGVARAQWSAVFP